MVDSGLGWKVELRQNSPPCSTSASSPDQSVGEDGGGDDGDGGGDGGGGNGKGGDVVCSL